MSISSNYDRLRSGSLASRLGSLASDSLVFGVASATEKLLGVVTIPVIARMLSVSEFGLVDFALVNIGIVVVLSCCGQDSAAARLFVDAANDVERKSVASQALIVQLANCAVVVCVLWMFQSEVGSMVFGPEAADADTIICIACVPAQLVLSCCRNICKWSFDRHSYVLLTLGFAVVNALFVVGTVCLADYGVRGYLLGYCASSWLFAVIGVIGTRQWLLWQPDVGVIKRLLGIGYPYWIISLSVSVMPFIDRSVIGSLLGYEALGSYVAGVRIASLLRFPLLALSTAWVPFSIALIRHKDADQTFNAVLKLVAVGVSCGMIVLCCFASECMRMIASEKYLEGVKAIAPLCIGIGVEALSLIAGIGILASQRTEKSLMSYVFGIAALCGTVVPFASHFGILGVALGVMLGQLVQAFTMMCYASRVCALKMRCAGPLSIVFASGFVCWASASSLQDYLWARIFVAASSLIVLGILAWSWCVDSGVRERLRSLVGRWFKSV